MINQVWQHRTSGDLFVVSVDNEGHAWGAMGPLHYSEILLEELGDYETERYLGVDFEGEKADAYRVLDDLEIAAVAFQHEAPCLACGGRGYMSYGPLNINCDQCFGTGLRESSPQHA